MIKLAKILLLILFTQSYSYGQQSDKEAILDTIPTITFDVDTTDLGVIDAGDIIEFDILFTNTGRSDLKIDLVTACKCLDIDWPSERILPGQKGKITVFFDSLGIEKGRIYKTIDIIANTNPIVVEARMKTVIQ
jgi:Protein of unknown function (DUF1573)